MFFDFCCDLAAGLNENADDQSCIDKYRYYIMKHLFERARRGRMVQNRNEGSTWSESESSKGGRFYLLKEGGSSVI